MSAMRMKPVELEIELFCRGMRIDGSCATGEGRRISRTRAGLGSGLEILIPARPKAIWMNVPVVESFTIRQCEPFVRALRDRVGGFIGVQAMPVPRASFHEYDALIDAGADHFSFCYEFEDPEVFARICPGKASTVGQQGFFEAMEYTAKKLGRGRVSGEIIAGVEPIAATKRGIDRIVNAGAFPTVCIFRPTIGSDMESAPPPDPDEMKEVFAYLYEGCRRADLPIGILPIEVSLVVQAEEAAPLARHGFGSALFGLKRRALRQLARPYIAWKLRPRMASAL